MFIAGGGNKDIPYFGSCKHGHDSKAVQAGLEGFDRVNFSNDDVGTHASGTVGNAPATPAVTADDKGFAGEEDVGGSQNAVDGGLAGAVVVVKEVFGIRVVDGDDRNF